MTEQITMLNVLKTYLEGVMSRAGHHANEVNQIVLSLIGGIIWKHDSCNVQTRNGEMKNILWFVVNNQRYAMKYNHENKNIELRKNSINGQLLEIFDNNSTNDNVKRIFENL